MVFVASLRRLHDMPVRAKVATRRSIRKEVLQFTPSDLLDRMESRPDLLTIETTFSPTKLQVSWLMQKRSSRTPTVCFDVDCDRVTVSAGKDTEVSQLLADTNAAVEDETSTRMSKFQEIMKTWNLIFTG